MQWTIPGTTLKGLRSDADRTDGLFQSLFLASPVGKRYNMEQVCRILNINILKGAVPLEQIVKLMAYLNGNLTDESDDLVDDTMLFFLFVKLASRARYIGGTKAWDDALVEVTEDYHEPVPGAREKLIKVLKVMLTVWCANQLKIQADKMMEEM